MASIIGNSFLEKLRSSDYKNSIFAIAEIIDNSIDAEARNVSVICTSHKGKITNLHFVDDGIGMDKPLLERCVIFSEGTNTAGTKKTGFYGMGLPNSSLSQCKKFSVISKKPSQPKFSQITIDFDQMILSGSTNVPSTTDADQTHLTLTQSTCNHSVSTIVVWENIDKLDAKKSSTLEDHYCKLIGKIHRYAIAQGIAFNFYTINDKNPAKLRKLAPYDPLYLMTGNTYVAKALHATLNWNINSSKDELNTPTYIQPHLDATDPDLPLIKHSLFYELETASQQVKVIHKGTEYSISLKAAAAYPGIQKPGTRNGGSSPIGVQIGHKLKGQSFFPGGNISWVRNGREITCDNHSLFNFTTPEARWWSIELSYETTTSRAANFLDQALGLTYTKQGFKFKAVPDDDQTIANDHAPFSEKQNELLSQITIALNDAIGKLQAQTKKQARTWASKEKELLGINPKPNPIPGGNSRTYDTLLDALGKGAKLSDDEQKLLVHRIKTMLPGLTKEQVAEGVQKYSDIGIQSIIVYCPIDHRDLFQGDKQFGKIITMINTDHIFYSSVIEPLEEKGDHDLLASIELLLSALSRAKMESSAGDREIINDYLTSNAKQVRQLLETKKRQSHRPEAEEPDED